MKKKNVLRVFAGAVAAVMLTASAVPTEIAAASTKISGNGFKEISEAWFDAAGGWNNNVAPNAIDPTIFTDADDKMYMVYGSWSGGLFILEVDRETGQVIYPGEDGIEPVSGNRIDRYFGTHIAGGNHQSGEAPFIVYDPETKYYWLYETYGGLTATGGYNMRLFRSKNVYGPYLDAAGNNAADSGTDNNKYGIKLIGNYRFFNQPGYRAAGHNSALIDDDGSRYLFFHQRFDEPENQTERHELRVRQQFLNEDNWPVTAVYEYRGEQIGHYADADVLGDYEVINHGTTSDGEMLESKLITLNADGTVTGEMTGEWWKTAGADYDYVTITTADKVTYKGVFFEQQDETDDNNIVMTFTAIGNNNESLWGSHLTMTEKEKAEFSATALDKIMPSRVYEDFTLPSTIKLATVEWETDNAAVLSVDGTVNQQESDTPVKLTATVKVNDEIVERSYTITVSAKPKVICAYDFETVDDASKTVSAASGASITTGAALVGTATVVEDEDRGKVLQIVSPEEVYDKNYLKLPSDTLANVNEGGYTVAMWVKCEENNWPHSALFNAMCSAHTDKYPMTRIGVNLIGRINANGYIDCPDNNDNAPDNIRDGQWHHVAYSINSTGIQIWRDGERLLFMNKDLTGCFDTSNDYSIQKADDVRIGSGSPWVDRDIENAMFDDVVVYSGTLREDAVKSLCTTGSATSVAGSKTDVAVMMEEPEADSLELEERSVAAAAEITRVSVHDPSIVKSDDGTYYVFGSHLADAKSTDLIHWEQMHTDYGDFDWQYKSIYGDIINNLAESFEWAGYDDGDCAGGNLAVWAPDVFWNEDYKWEDGSTGAWMVYYSASSTWRRSCIGYAVCKNIEGPYEYVDTVIYSGFTKTGVADGNSTRNTKWDNDYLNLTELIEEYNNSLEETSNIPPVSNVPSTGTTTAPSDSMPDSTPNTPDSTPNTPATGTYTEVNKPDGSKQFLDSNGEVVTNSLVTAQDGNTYYTLEDGAVATNQVVTDDNAKYFAKEDGAIAKQEICTTSDGEMVYALEDGKLATNQVVAVDGKKYLAKEDSTIATSGFFTTGKGNQVYARKDGSLITGRSFTVNGKRYYTAASGAVVKSGFYKTMNGKRVYAKASGTLVTGGTFKVDGKRYYANKNGVIAVSKWIKVGNNKYYCSASGAITKVKKVK